MCTYSAGCLVISPSSGHGGTAANNIPYSIALLNAQRRRVPALSPEKQPPQIRRLAAENREQFRVRAQGLGKGLRAWRGSGNGQLLQEAGRSWIFHKSNWKEKHQISCIHLVIGIEHSRYNSFRLR